MQKHFDLGQKVRYIRLSPEGKPETGEGFIAAHLIDVNKREKYLVKDGDKAYNCEPYAIDASEEEEAMYIHHVKKLRETADLYNKRSDDIIKEGMTAVDRLNNELFGEPIAC